MKYFITLAIIVSITLSAISQNPDIDQKVDSVLNLMTLDEKIGQMAQAEKGALENIYDISYYSLGSLLSGGGSSPASNTLQGWINMYDNYQSIALESRLGIPLIYGIDAVHGHNNVYGAVIFPHNIGIGCTWNPELVKTANQIVAKEVAATGIDWTFSPCITVPQNERWGRTYEGFGETSEIQKIMSGASIDGLQGSDLSNPETILACAKHFVGDGGTINGIDQGNTIVTEQILRELHMAGYIDAINLEVGSIMASYNSWNGVKLHGHDYLLTDVLKNELGFNGFIVSDWKGVDQVNEDYRDAVKRSINAGIDMVMVPDRYIYFISILKSLVQDNEVSIERIDDAVKRILKQKFLLNLFDEPFTNNSLASSFGSVAHRNIAKQTVRESMVLLNAKNDVLPLQKNNKKILVAGKLASDLGAQCGGWTISWQGSNGNITEGTNILTGIQNLAESSEVIYSENGNYNNPVDVAVVVIGENPYAEGAGDRVSLNIDMGDINLIKNIKEKGIPVVAVLISGRPMIISEIMPYTDAFIAAWLPGTEGDGIAEILFGDYEPSGKLTHSWPTEMSQIPINYGDINYNPLFEYKHGLQHFPSSSYNQKVEPYGAIALSDGSTIALTLTDNITALNYENDDFEIKINNEVIPDNIVGVNFSDFDESILLIELNTPIVQTDNILLSYSGNGIYSSNLILNVFADLYIYNGVMNNGGTNVIPGKIEAENYFDMFGIQTEPCTDIGGGINVAYIEPGDWMKYSINVTQSGNYEIKARIAGYNGGNLLLTFNDSIQKSVNYNPTNGWQSWQNFATSVFLEEGEYVMKAKAQSDAFNINYFDFTVSDGVGENKEFISNIMLYPNPARKNTTVEFSNSMSGNLSIKLFTIDGKPAQTLYLGKSRHGINKHNFSIDESLPAGLYYMEFKDDTRRYFEKVILE